MAVEKEISSSLWLFSWHLWRFCQGSDSQSQLALRLPLEKISRRIDYILGNLDVNCSNCLAFFGTAQNNVMTGRNKTDTFSMKSTRCLPGRVCVPPA